MKKRNFGRGITLAVICLGALLLSACGGTFTMSAPKMLSIVIASPPEKVFNYLKNPQHDSEWAMKGWTITNWQGEGLGATADWVLELEGKTFRGKMVVVDYIPNQKVVDYLTGDAWGTITWLLVPVKGGTKVIEVNALSTEVPTAAKAAMDVVVKEITKALEQELQKLKAVLEK